MGGGSFVFASPGPESIGRCPCRVGSNHFRPPPFQPVQFESRNPDRVVSLPQDRKCRGGNKKGSSAATGSVQYRANRNGPTPGRSCCQIRPRLAKIFPESSQESGSITF